MSESLSSHTTEPGRIARDATQANQTGWKRWLPGLNTLRAYESSWLRHDLVAGLVMTTMLVPVGIAYAEASGVAGINGLYATIVPLLAYALFGPSRILVLGPDSALAVGSKLPALGYTVPYAVGNILLTAWGPVIVMLTN
jgi:Sulfate permease family